MAVEGLRTADIGAARNFRARHPVVDRVVTSLTDRPTHSLSQAGRALAEGGIGGWALFTDGLIVNGPFPGAVNRLLQAKGIPPELIARGERPVVSVLPDREHRTGLIDVAAHPNPQVQQALMGPDSALLTQDGAPLFYRVFAGPAEYLHPPLTQIDPATGKPTIVMLWHDNPRLSRLEAELRQAAPGQPVLLTGSSANITGEKQAAMLRDLDPRVRDVVDFTVNARDRAVYQIPSHQRGSIPMIDLTTDIPTVRRISNMYDALPRDEGLRNLLVKNSAPAQR